MKRLIFAGMLVLITTAAHAQAYTTLGPAGAGGYRSGTQRDSYSTTGDVPPNTRRHRHSKSATLRSIGKEGAGSGPRRSPNAEKMPLGYQRAASWVAGIGCSSGVNKPI